MKVSQITTVYNVEEWLEKTIQSFLSQTLKESELVLVNDCSPDGCADIIAKYADNPRIKVVNNECNVGAGMSRQIGIDASIGEYTIFVDGDDWLENDCLEKMYNEAITTGADMVSCTIYQHNDYGLYTTRAKGEVWYREDRCCFLNNKLVKRDMWSKTHYSPLRFREDINTLYRLMELTNNIVYMSYAGYHYNLRPLSLTTTKGQMCKEQVYQALATIENIEWAKDNLEQPSRMYKSLYNIRRVWAFYKLAKKYRNGDEHADELERIENYLKSNNLWKQAE
jgi:glycosyltransferase involved in cell wall biosynthesis